jgi:hypothetical protein
LFLNGPKVLPHPLAERLRGLEAVAALGGVQADAFAGAMVHGDEDVALAFAGGDGGRYVGPHMTSGSPVVIVPS